ERVSRTPPHLHAVYHVGPGSGYRPLLDLGIVDVRGEDRARHHGARGVAGADEHDVRPHAAADTTLPLGTTETASPRAARLFPLRAVVLPFLVSRLISDALILVMAKSRSFLDPAFHSGFAKWDGTWYVNLANIVYRPV